MTKADKIRENRSYSGMTDKELADYFISQPFPPIKPEPCRNLLNCQECWLAWLQEEVKEDENDEH